MYVRTSRWCRMEEYRWGGEGSMYVWTSRWYKMEEYRWGGGGKYVCVDQ